MKCVLLSWSCGKDSVWALHLLRSQPGIEIAALLRNPPPTADPCGGQGDFHTCVCADFQ